MTGASTSTYEIRNPLLGETLEVGRKDDNDHDKYAMAITRREDIVEQDETSLYS